MPPATDLPHGFVDLKTLWLEKNLKVQAKEYSVIGMVVDTFAPIVNQRGDLQVTFRIFDQRLFNFFKKSPKGFLVRFFTRPYSSDQLPQDLTMGDVILLRQPIDVVSYQDEPIIRPYARTPWVLFRSNSIPKPFFAVGYAAKQRLACEASSPAVKDGVTESEQLFVIQLKAEVDHLIGRAAGQADGTKRPAADTLESRRKHPRVGGFGPKFKLIEQLRDRMFADICGEVVKTFAVRSGDVELYVTDFTTNPQLWSYEKPSGRVTDTHDETMHEPGRDGDDFGYSHSVKKTPKGFPGPYGKRVLKVMLKDPHAEEARSNVREGCFVLLQNVKCTFVPGTSVLQGDMWPDWDDPTRVKLRLLKNLTTPEIIAIRERKAEYLVEHGPPKDARGATRKGKKQAAVDDRRYTSETQSSRKSGGSTRCSHGEVPFMSLADVLDMANKRHNNSRNTVVPFDLPFVNAKYRTRATIVDFHPSELHDFAVQREIDPQERSEFSQDANWELTPKWEWAFSLLLQDASGRGKDRDSCAWVHVSHLDAQFLLGNDMPDPTDLRQDAKLLAKLREKLFCLWGNLEETKSPQSAQTLSNVPFECCIREYGQPVDIRDKSENASTDYIRLYQLFGVTIM
ncbi:hypothetical protein K431DRAFT_271988 [Polychaeton citri CBS 116435]|uniref:Protection of telomeres protein 1 ssDNA-binding domain-containing protein n=1 Tax=Polychaeton citri CBS 116435 TaxID=1314669 RepID=A0A9P4Q371_9PEZI|nr:hypothetical protein K431DRAFT_271988 [Polychaeton citri CBS 116435]